MQTLRASTFIAKLMLAWFALFLGSAIASTLIQPEHKQWVCTTGGGMKWVDTTGDDADLQASLGMDCPLCASVNALTPPLVTPFEKPSALAHALHPVVEAEIASIAAPPLPSRGPPTAIV